MAGGDLRGKGRGAGRDAAYVVRVLLRPGPVWPWSLGLRQMLCWSCLLGAYSAPEAVPVRRSQELRPQSHACQKSSHLLDFIELRKFVLQRWLIRTKII